MGVIEISRKHGQEMYIIALEHAIQMFEIGGEAVLPQLKNKIEECRKEIENE